LINFCKLMLAKTALFCNFYSKCSLICFRENTRFKRVWNTYTICMVINPPDFPMLQSMTVSVICWHITENNYGRYSMWSVPCIYNTIQNQWGFHFLNDHRTAAQFAMKMSQIYSIQTHSNIKTQLTYHCRIC
jgi:hypothetical protein